MASLALLITMLAKGDQGLAIVILCLLAPLSFILLSLVLRKVELDHQGITYKTIFRKRRISWEEVSDIRVFTAGLKKVLYLGSKEIIVLIPLVMDRREKFLDELKTHLSGNELPQDSLDTLTGVRGFWAEPAFLWIAAVILLGILVLRLR